MRRGDINLEELAKYLLWHNIVYHKNEDSGYDIITASYGDFGPEVGEIGHYRISSCIDPYSYERLTWKELCLALGLFEDTLIPDGHDCHKCPDERYCHAYFKYDEDQERCSGWESLLKEGKV